MCIKTGIMPVSEGSVKRYDCALKRRMALKRLPLVLNPTSGGGAGRRQGQLIKEQLAAQGIEAQLHETTGPGSARAIARTLTENGATAIIAAGGDGTLHEVANGLLEASEGTSCTLGVIPVGTGNDFVKMVPGATTISGAVSNIASGSHQRFDVGRVRWIGGSEYFINGMGTGIDVEVVRQMTRLPHMPGSLKYLVALLRSLFRFKPPRLRATIDGHVIDRRMMIVAVGNGVCQGGGFYLAPAASAQDGQFDVTVVGELSLTGIVRVLPRVMRGTHQGDRAVEMHTGRSIRLEAIDERPLFFHLDGELREPAGLRALDIEVMHRRLPVFVRQEDS